MAPDAFVINLKEMKILESLSGIPIQNTYAMPISKKAPLVSFIAEYFPYLLI